MVIFIDIGCVTRRVQARVVVGLAGCPASPGACVSVFSRVIRLSPYAFSITPRRPAQTNSAAMQANRAKALRPSDQCILIIPPPKPTVNPLNVRQPRLPTLNNPIARPEFRAVK